MDSLISGCGTSFDFNVTVTSGERHFASFSPRELSPSATVAPFLRKDTHRLWDDLCGRERLVVHLNPDSSHTLPLTLARLLGNTKEMEKQKGLGTSLCLLVGLALTLS